MAGQSSTHGVTMHADRVVKTYVSWSRGEHEQEWRALNLLAQYAPDLAPLPLEADLQAKPPVIVMSRLDGVPLRGQAVTPEQIEAMAEAITTLHESVPASVLAGMAPSPWNASVALAKARRLRAEQPDLGDDPLVTRAFAKGAEWLDDYPTDEFTAAEVAPVLGLSDGNLANYLWDGKRVRMVDWEDSGRSDRAFELAEVIEHISRFDGTFDGSALLEQIQLTTTEATRMLDLRRLLVFAWLCTLGPGGLFSKRNPAGSLERQADRLLGLLH
ncbi:aminoglycoside phosphotransferase family protein [Planotetraspora sp. A-T 1434]|uniref:phosphotransferase family protein n=1 Tax=Planotetraspora sp. A-T 1434 TaxID=2979219 RepID=UPI0021BE2ED3|nr:aminoglycoside phosphotransferase family protein [Planotetraspora sp. A-T 1434]MCT9931857.1 aminoglycoside phosphotransferase family protein [Planotetraspora sp. A-T 1434]